MSADENLELVRRLADGINADELPRDLVTDDFELTNATTAVTDATYHGYDGGLKWRADLFDVVEGARYKIDEILAATDEYVVVTNSLVGRGSSSGAPVDLRWSSVFWFREGKIARAVGYNTRRAALEAVGLSP
jgi:ketosteroid isomerase-like protein